MRRTDSASSPIDDGRDDACMQPLDPFDDLAPVRAA